MSSTTRFLLSENTLVVKHIPIKRIFDVVFSSIALVLGLPLFLCIAFGIVCSSRGNIFYSQIRVGRGGKLFRCYKFRTMYPDAESRLQHLLTNHPEFKQEWEKNQKLKQDPRVTPFGNLLRKTSLDELPQFWNVFLGDLSIVGPRPVLAEEVYKYMGKKAVKILSVRPGITGLWQVLGRSNINYKFRVRLDEKYVLKRTFLLDLLLIIKTIPVMIFCRGAY